MGEKIRAIIKSPNGKYLDSIKGEIKDGVFNYKEGGFLGFGGETKTAPVDENGIEEISKKERVLKYKRIGKDLTQISDKEFSSTSSHIADILSTFKIAKLEEDKILTKPMNLAQLLSFLLLIVVIVACVGIWFMSSTTQKAIAQDVAPYNKSVAQNGAELTLLQNQTKTMLLICNATAHALIVSHGLSPSG